MRSDIIQYLFFFADIEPISDQDGPIDNKPSHKQTKNTRLKGLWRLYDSHEFNTAVKQLRYSNV